MNVSVIETDYVVKTTPGTASEKLQITDSQNKFTFDILAIPLNCNASEFIKGLDVTNLSPSFNHDKNDQKLYEYRYYAIVYTDIYYDHSYIDLVYKRLFTLTENRNIHHSYKINSKIVQCGNFPKDSKCIWNVFYKLGNYTFISNVWADKLSTYKGFPILVDSFVERFSNNIYIYNEQENVKNFTKKIEKYFDEYYEMPSGCIEISNGLIKYEVDDYEFYYLKLKRKSFNVEKRDEYEIISILDTSKNLDDIVKVFHKFKFYNLKFSLAGIKARDKLGNEMYIGLNL